MPLSPADDVHMSDKITISKQFKEKVIRPILKVWQAGLLLPVHPWGVLSGFSTGLIPTVPDRLPTTHAPPMCKVPASGLRG